MGTAHDETGLLLWEGPHLVLARDDGGRWRLDGPARLEKLVGRRVRVLGVRSGFDLLDVRRFDPA